MGSAAYKKDLVNIIKLCDLLGNPEKKFKCIHVGGTNGKGSVSHMLAAVFQQAGYKTGLYTSPHLYDFRERIRINGRMAEESFIVEFVERIQPAIENIAPSFFEITVAMAFEYFAQQKTDIAIIEVGLGGRLDSTNIIDPEVSIITNIGWDHMNLLGNSLGEIAAEKGGIIKKNRPVVIGEKKEETASVFMRIAEEKKAPLFFAEDRFEVEDFELNAETINVQVHDKSIDTIDSFVIDLPGIYQAKNILSVLQSLQILKDWNIDKNTIVDALAHVRAVTHLQGRWEVIRKDPTVVLEVAHNMEGVQQMLKHVKHMDFDQLKIVIGIVKDKDPERLLGALPAGAQYYFTQAHIPRSLPKEELQKKAESFQLQGQCYEDVNVALTRAISEASPHDLVIVCGSIFLVAEVDRKLIREHS
jgi:dihydrofolate synthase/folylpolyglutamate synthase